MLEKILFPSLFFRKLVDLKRYWRAVFSPPHIEMQKLKVFARPVL